MTLGELFNNLAQKAGINADDTNLKSLLTNEALAAIVVPADLATGIDGGLLNIEAAKSNHPDIKKKYFADAYDGIDKQLMGLIADGTFEQTDLDEIKNEKSTSKKQELIISKLKAAKKSDKGANAEEWNKKIADANEAARLAKADNEKIKTEYEGKIKDIHLDAALNSTFGNYKTIYDELPGGVKKNALKAMIQQALQDKNAKLVTDDNGNLQIVGNDGSNVFGSNHVQLTAQSFLDQSFAPILKVSGTTPAATPAGTPPPVNTGAPGGNATNGLVKSINDAAIAAMSAPAQSMM